MAQDLALFVVFFDLMLVPFFFLTGSGAARDRVAATIKLVIYTLVGSLLMLAAAVATGVLAGAGPTARRRFSISAPSRERPLRDGHAGLDLPVLRAAFLDEDAGLPAPRLDARRLRDDAAAGARASSPACCPRSPPTASCASRCRCSPTPRSDFQTLMLLLALASILYGSAMAFTTTNARLVLGYSSVAQLGFIMLGIFALASRGRPGRDPAGGQPRPGRRAAVLHRRAARRARRRLGGHARHGRPRVPRARARGAVPDRGVRDAGDARLVELRRRVPASCSASSTRSS